MDPEPTGSPAGVLFDMDGTLVDSEKVWTLSLADTAVWLGGSLSTRAREDMVGSNMTRTLVILFEDLGLEASPEAYGKAQTYLTERTAELFAEGLEWRPGAREALELARAGGPTALVTNTGRALTERALDTIGRHWFTTTVCGDEVRHGKPAPDPYLRAARLLGLEPARCLAVEDSPTGALAAERAGVPVLVVPCEIPVPAGPGRVQRDSLVGLTAAELTRCHEEASNGRSAWHPGGGAHRV